MSTSTTGKPFITGEQFLAEPQKQQKWLIRPLLPVGGIVNIFGKPKTGKSFASLGMGLAIANGDPSWNGFSVETHGRVAYLQIDTPGYEMHERLTNVKLAGYDVSNLFLADITIAPYPFNVFLPQHQAWLRQQLKELDPVLVFIDTLREAHDGDENDSKQMKQVINILVSIAHPVAIGLISHARKDFAKDALGAESDIMDAARGSGYVSGRMDTVIRFTGRDKKGTMYYLGRSKGANGKMAFVQDEDTGLVFQNEREASLEAAVLQVVKEHKQDWSMSRMADWVSKATGQISPRRAQDWVKPVLEKELGRWGKTGAS